MILVTGGTGLVGSHLLLELIKAGEAVKALKRPTSNVEQVRKTFSWYSEDADTLFEKVEWVEGDITDIYSLDEVLKGVTEIYHCAGLVSFYKKDRYKLERTNHHGTANVVNAALKAGVKKLCHVSSVSALGKEKQGETITENHLWKTSKRNSFYAISKYAAEREVWRGIEEGLDSIIVIPSIILGPGNWNSGSTRLFTTVSNGMPFYSNGVNGYIDVRDVASLMLKLMKSKLKNERYIFSAEDVSFRNIITMIASSLGKVKPFIKLAPWMGEMGWRVEQVKLLAGVKPTFSKEIARAAFGRFYFSNDKLSTALQHDYIPTSKSIEDTAQIFLKDFKGK
jgi:nucleoside-diphosphate-sugar epimerase